MVKKKGLVRRRRKGERKRGTQIGQKDLGNDDLIYSLFLFLIHKGLKNTHII